MPYLVQHVNTGKIYENINACSKDTSISRAIIENCLKKDCSWNTQNFAYVSEPVVDVVGEGIKVGDYVLLRSGTIFVYGTLSSIQARTDLSSVIIAEQVSKASRDKYGRFIVEIDSEETLKLFEDGFVRECLRRQKIRFSKR